MQVGLALADCQPSGYRVAGRMASTCECVEATPYWRAIRRAVADNVALRVDATRVWKAAGTSCSDLFCVSWDGELSCDLVRG